MVQKTLIALLAATLALGLGAQAARANTGAARLATETSSNWAGYAVTRSSKRFTKVSGRWIAPPAVCAPGVETYAAFWIGLGGYAGLSNGIEQIGTEADCTPKTGPTYSMWYELYPAPSMPIQLEILPGDAITASVAVVGKTVTLKIANETRGTSFAKKVRMAAPDLSSAEWVAEAPTVCADSGKCAALPLTNFGTVAFTHASVTAAGHTGTIQDRAWSATSIALIEDATERATAPFLASAPVNRALPGALTKGGGGFAVSWLTALAPLLPAGQLALSAIRS